MSVVMPNCELTARVKDHPWGRDERGIPVPAAEATIDVRGPYPGGVKEQPDGSWSLRLDPAVWPIQTGDVVTDGTLTWVVTGIPRLHGAGMGIAYVAATGTLDPPRVP